MPLGPDFTWNNHGRWDYVPSRLPHFVRQAYIEAGDFRFPMPEEEAASGNRFLAVAALYNPAADFDQQYASFSFFTREGLEAALSAFDALLAKVEAGSWNDLSLESRLDKVGKAMARSIFSEFVRNAALEKVEDAADIKAYNEALADDDGTRYSMDDVMRMAIKAE